MKTTESTAVRLRSRQLSHQREHQRKLKRNILKAMEELETYWLDEDLTEQSVLSKNYPFNSSFDEMMPNVRKWVSEELTSEEIEEHIDCISINSGLNFEDCSSSNDLSGSCYEEQYGIRVMLPNSVIHNPSEEMYSDFIIRLDDSKLDGEIICEYDEFVSESMFKLVSAIKEIIKSAS